MWGVCMCVWGGVITTPLAVPSLARLMQNAGFSLTSPGSPGWTTPTSGVHDVLEHSTKPARPRSVEITAGVPLLSVLSCLLCHTIEPSLGPASAIPCRSIWSIDVDRWMGWDDRARRD